MHRILTKGQHVSRSNNVRKLSTNARRLVKCSKSSTITCSMFKLNTVTDHYSLSCQSNLIKSTFNTAAASPGFNRHRCYKINFPTLWNFLLTSKIIFSEYFQTIKIAYLQRLQYQPRNDHQTLHLGMR